MHEATAERTKRDKAFGFAIPVEALDLLLEWAEAVGTAEEVEFGSWDIKKNQPSSKIFSQNTKKLFLFLFTRDTTSTYLFFFYICSLRFFFIDYSFYFFFEVVFFFSINFPPFPLRFSYNFCLLWQFTASF